MPPDARLRLQLQTKQLGSLKSLVLGKSAAMPWLGLCRCWGVQHVGNIVANLYTGTTKNPECEPKHVDGDRVKDL